MGTQNENVSGHLVAARESWSKIMPLQRQNHDGYLRPRSCARSACQREGVVDLTLLYVKSL